ncbi:MAG: exodeoxyribonuclease V subunit beta [Burkholderiaceae bacterium]
MNPAPRPLEFLQFPLWGSQLIEASAGTGKTFAITLLYLRLVLTHAGPGDSQQPGRSPEEVLVVTFTEAATQELRGRIREALGLAARCFGQRLVDADQSRPLLPLLLNWRSQFAQDQWPIHAQTIQTAAQAMDAAAISTIHGWCYRMLREHAFDSLNLFQQRLQMNGEAQRQQAVRDYWRRFYDPLSVPVMDRIAKFWKTPSDLDKLLRPLIAYAAWPGENEKPDDLGPEEICRAHDRAIAQDLAPHKAHWAQWVVELRAVFAQADAANAFDRRRFMRNHYGSWLDAIARWADDPAAIDLTLNTGWTRLTPQGLAQVWKEGSPPDHPAIRNLSGLHTVLTAIASPRSALLQHALRWVVARCQGERRMRTELDFDDMLGRFVQALRGENGPGLAAAIRSRFPVALIDEFQDTDPLQYEIVDRIYGVAQNRPETCLVMIGDPKQAIYSFRQADIYTYLQARRDAQARIYSLSQNFRSTPEMVAAVNAVFEGAELRAQGKGAFLFREGENNPVPFIRAGAQASTHALTERGRPVCPVTWTVHAPARGDGANEADGANGADRADGGVTKDQYLSDMARACAGQISYWLSLAEAGEMGFTAAGSGSYEPLAPRHIAVLVDNRQQAALVRRALASRGLRSVYLSDKESVYQTPQAEDVYRWLQACAHPEDESLVRAALATAALGLSIPDLFALTRNELDWEACLGQFQRYRDVWLRRGVLPMLRKILVDFGISPRLLQVSEDGRGQTGERILTDLLHLAELLQQASVRLEGPQALLRYFAQQRSEASGDEDGERRRLETDDALIRVVTIHKAKGLQYPVVLLPFASAARPVKPSDRPIKWHNADGHLALAWDEVGDDVLALSDAERLAEDIRKLYVAFTRAEHLLWVGTGPIQNQGPRAIDYLLWPDPVSDRDFLSAMAQWAENLDHHQVRSVFAGEGDGEQPVGSHMNTTLLPDTLTPAHAANGTDGQRRTPMPPRGFAASPGGHARVPTRQGHDGWSVSSYSGIKARAVATDLEAVAATLPLDSAGAENLIDMGQEPFWPWLETPIPPKGPLHRFPKGSESGTFLHGLLEWAARQGFASVSAAPQAFAQEVDRRCQAFGWATWAREITPWLLGWMRTELPLAGFTLQLDRAAQTRPELEFWIAACAVDVAALDSLVSAGCLPGKSRKPLTAHQLTGMLKGFIDLIVLHEGRYFVVDYKSNWLGPTDADYTAEALAVSVLENRYELQYALYLLALHRLLRSRIPNYSYDQHIGGAAYFFLRGLHGPCRGVHFERPPLACIASLDSLFLGGEGGLS